jgi:hypothetical protein
MDISKKVDNPGGAQGSIGELDLPWIVVFILLDLLLVE